MFTKLTMVTIKNNSSGDFYSQLDGGAGWTWPNQEPVVLPCHQYFPNDTNSKRRQYFIEKKK